MFRLTLYRLARTLCRWWWWCVPHEHRWRSFTTKHLRGSWCDRCGRRRDHGNAAPLP